MHLGFGQKGGVHELGMCFEGFMSDPRQVLDRTQFRRHNLLFTDLDVHLSTAKPMVKGVAFGYELNLVQKEAKRALPGREGLLWFLSTHWGQNQASFKTISSVFTKG